MNNNKKILTNMKIKIKVIINYHLKMNNCKEILFKIKIGKIINNYKQKFYLILLR